MENFINLQNNINEKKTSKNIVAGIVNFCVPRDFGMKCFYFSA